MAVGVAAVMALTQELAVRVVMEDFQAVAVAVRVQERALAVLAVMGAQAALVLFIYGWRWLDEYGSVD